jgi:ElaB/YqjD/DUF883 family membrane-anchored ribosome-binding protein
MKERARKEDFVSERAAETLRGAKERASEAYDRTAEAATQWTHDAVEYGRNNPLLTSLVVFGTGVGLGCWLAYERRPRYSKRLVPAVAGAVAHAVREALEARR